MHRPDHLADVHPPRPRWALIVAGIGLACTLMPFHCSVNVGSTHRAWDHGGPLFGGVVAMLFGAYALLRRRGPLDGRGKLALAAIALGAAAAVYGYATIERIGGTGDVSSDLVPAIDRTLGALARGDDRAALDGADPGLRSAADGVHRMAALLQRRFGAYRSASDLQETSGADHLVATSGTATFANGALRFELVFRTDGDAAHLAGLSFHDAPGVHPSEPADQAARALVSDIAAGAVERVHERLDPGVAPSEEFDDVIRQLHAGVGDAATVVLTDQRACGDGLVCFELAMRTHDAQQRVKITEGDHYGLWLATDVTFVPN